MDRELNARSEALRHALYAAKNGENVEITIKRAEAFLKFLRPTQGEKPTEPKPRRPCQGQQGGCEEGSQHTRDLAQEAGMKTLTRRLFLKSASAAPLAAKEAAAEAAKQAGLLDVVGTVAASPPQP